MATRILIADDHPVLRSGLRVLLAADPDLEVVGEAGSGEETLHLAEELRPDVVLLDIGMPGESGIETVRRLKAKLPALKVLFLTMHEEEGMLLEALGAGGDGYLIKRADEAEIIQAIRVVQRGDVYVHPTMTRALLSQTETTERPQEPVEPLTQREIDVLRLLARGNTNRQIAELLGLSTRTVESHRANLMGKLGLSSRVELVTYAEEHRLL
ncbi:MAG TPA: response regulator transcription factor [Thermoanaerobaculia bacterium]|nr:response regulator transcription factor [Thermoanaerobaculia bacterium]